MKIVVTGATGYIGERLINSAVLLGHEVIAASRRQPNAQIEWILFDLSSLREIQLPEGTDVVFHLAAETTLNALDPNIEIDVAQRLITAAKQAGAIIIFVSSQTAREDAPTDYGRTKWQIERLIHAAGGVVVRPGQVYGGAERALFGVLVNTLRRWPVIPVFIPSPKVQPIHIDDLVTVLLRCAELNSTSPPGLCVGATIPVSFTHFLHTIALARLRRLSLPIPIPVAFIKLTGTIIGPRLRKKWGLERLISLFDLPLMETGHDLQLLRVSLRPLSSGMTPSGDDRRRNLIREGQALLAYVLKANATMALTRRYVRCIENTRSGKPIHLPDFIIHYPVLIALLDEPSVLSSPSGAEFIWRLNASVVLAEASIQGAQRFLGIGETSSFITGLWKMSAAIVLEAFWRLATLLVVPILRPLLRRSGLSR